MSFVKDMLSGDNSVVDIKAMFSVLSFITAVFVYATYALWFRMDLPANLAATTQWLVGAGAVSAGATALTKTSKPNTPEG